MKEWFSPVGAWLAVKGSGVSGLEVLQMIVLAAAVVLWLVGFDIIYSLQDFEFDRAQRLHHPARRHETAELVCHDRDATSSGHAQLERLGTEAAAGSTRKAC